MTALLAALIFLAAALYASVGHGGASAYLAILTLFGGAPAEVSSTALILNCLVSSVAFVAYARAGHFSIRLLLPFAITSVPAAFLGGGLVVPPQVYSLLLVVALLAAAARLAIVLPAGHRVRPPSRPVAAITGAVIGLLSGIVGVGGGIFLSPLLMLLGWAGAKQTAAVSAAFILVNSLAGLAGRLVRGGIEVGNLVPLIIVAFAGGVLGSWIGASRLTALTLRRLLAVVLIVAAVKALLAA